MNHSAASCPTRPTRRLGWVALTVSGATAVATSEPLDARCRQLFLVFLSCCCCCSVKSLPAGLPGVSPFPPELATIMPVTARYQTRAIQPGAQPQPARA